MDLSIAFVRMYVYVCTYVYMCGCIVVFEHWQQYLCLLIATTLFDLSLSPTAGEFGSERLVQQIVDSIMRATEKSLEQVAGHHPPSPEEERSGSSGGGFDREEGVCVCVCACACVYAHITVCCTVCVD